MEVSQKATGKTAIGYAPKAKLSVLKDAESKGYKIFTNIDDLIGYILDN